MKIVGYFFLSLVLLACKQKHSQSNLMEDKSEVMIKKYTPMQLDSRPYYTIQIAKGGSAIELLVNDIMVYRHREQGGLSVNVPINATLMKSGSHELKLKVYPDKGKTSLDEYTYTDIDVRLYADVEDPADDYQSVLKFELPEETKTSQIPYFEVALPFEAEVPFDFSTLLDEAEVLKGQNHIEKEVIAEYEKAHEAFKRLDAKWFMDKRNEANNAVANAFYLTREQFEKRDASFKELFDPTAEVQALENYEIEYAAKGKIAFLVQKITKAPVLRSIINKGEADQEEITIMIGLYRKKGSSDFSAF